MSESCTTPAKRMCTSSEEFEEEFHRQLMLRSLLILENEGVRNEGQFGQSDPLTDTVSRSGALFRRLAILLFGTTNVDFARFDQVVPMGPTALAGRGRIGNETLHNVIDSHTGGNPMVYGAERFEENDGINVLVTKPLGDFAPSMPGTVTCVYRSLEGRDVDFDMLNQAVFNYVLAGVPMATSVSYMGGNVANMVFAGFDKVHVCTKKGNMFVSPMVRDEALLLTTNIGCFEEMNQIAAMDGFVATPSQSRCYSGVRCSIPCSVYVVDHTAENLSPVAVIKTAVAKGAKIVYGWFLVDKDMEIGKSGTFGITGIPWVARSAGILMGKVGTNKREMSTHVYQELVRIGEWAALFPGVECTLNVLNERVIVYKLVLDEEMSLHSLLGGYVMLRGGVKHHRMLDGGPLPHALFDFDLESARAFYGSRR